MKTLKQAVLDKKRVLVRVDFNVPLDSKGNVVNDEKIKATIPTIKYILSKNVSQLILMTHAGEPDGKVIKNLRTYGIAKRLSKLIGFKVVKVDDCIDVTLPDSKVILLENLRFHNEEKEDDEGFAKKLASFAELYVNDAFGVSHRRHASVHAITRFLPSYAGLLLEKEVSELDKIRNPKHPFIAVLGGAKVEDKLKLIQKLLKKADKVIIVGAMIYPFYKASGLEIGKSFCEGVEIAKNLNSKKIILPDYVVVAEKKNGRYINIRTVHKNKVGSNDIGLDIGEQSIDDFYDTLKTAKTIFWNGPLGMYETKPFDKGTILFAKSLSKLSADIVIGGGDVVSAFRKAKVSSKNIHISTGGGASITFIEGELPGIKALG